MQEEQDAELRYLQDNSTAFGDQDAPAGQEEPQPQEVQLISCLPVSCCSQLSYLDLSVRPEVYRRCFVKLAAIGPCSLIMTRGQRICWR